MSKPRGLLEESFQYCRGPTSRPRMILLNEVVKKPWCEKSIYLAGTVQDLVAEG